MAWNVSGNVFDNMTYIAPPLFKTYCSMDQFVYLMVRSEDSLMHFAYITPPSFENLKIKGHKFHNSIRDFPA